MVSPWREVKLLRHGDSLMRFFERAGAPALESGDLSPQSEIKPMRP